MNQEEIKKILPHRDHMLLIDEAELREGKAYGKKTIRGDEFFLQGHFPGNPVVPGVILCEIMAQTCCVLMGRARVSCFPVRQRALPPSLRDWIRCALKTPYTPGMYLKQNVPCSSIKVPSTGQRARAM